tara:strand:- start:630 stop:1721 length:1092 start_codon:yes stop_codon:yes gene_type:complete
VRVYIITGESSGDQHASHIAKQLFKLDKDITIKAWGGENLKSENVNLDQHIDELNFMGFWEVFKNGFNVLNNLKKCKKNLIDFAPDIVLLVDFPGFNLEIAKFTNSVKIKTYYYISPKIWAWKKNRIKNIKKYVDQMFVVFPFEKDYYKIRGVDVKYLGNPVLEFISKNKFSLIEKDKPIISLLPGSRKQEIDKILPIMLEATKNYSDFSFIISASSRFSSKYYSDLISGYDVEVIFDNQYSILKSSIASIITSGTSTLEAALLNTPQIVCYKTSALSFFIAKLFVKIKHISLVNILLNKNSVVELIQSDLKSENIIKHLDNLLDYNLKNKLLNDYEYLRKLLETKQSVSLEIAKEILNSKFA